MSTGVESWNQNLLDIGAMYPFPGTEWLWVIIGVVTWLLWHVVQMRKENRLLEEEEAQYVQTGRLEKAMAVSNAETLIETMKVHGEGYRMKQPSK